MKMKGSYLSKSVVVKWLLLLAVVFAVSLPVSSRLCQASENTYRVSVDKGYLALRTAKSFDRANEIGELYTGDIVEVSDYSDSTYWYVYSSKYGKYGYVNKNYLIAENTSASSGSAWTVSVDKGYLALRSAKAYDASNEIGELYTGDTVEVNDSSDSTYWYVYSPKYGKYGYVNKNYLVSSSCPTWTVSVDKGYLALRSAKAYDASNEIGELYTGDTVQVYDSSDSTYWYVYSPKYDKYGYVNKNYLYSGSSSSADVRTVSVDKGYLALRNAKAYDSSNEIGELYTGDTVEVINTSDSTYWYVYSPKHNKNGYVNKNYLSGSGSENNITSYPTRTVSVSKGYLALRSAKAYDASNEIGELYTGDVVEVIDSSDSTYWYVYSSKLGKYGYVNSEYLR
ncbi:MAG: SH3 domain-containing protein [Eubacteriales bacterium]|nr:SH3 domain-containing protein [Eubacteriales bacterium]